MARKLKGSRLTLGTVALVALLSWLAQLEDSRREASRRGDGGTGFIEQLYSERRSGEVVEGVGIVSKLLSDDRKGSQHQRFLLRLDSGHSLLVSHNIDLAPRIESLRVGDEVRFRGQYEWNERGGVVHWTHHDPAGERPGGWLRHASRTYQ